MQRINTNFIIYYIINLIFIFIFFCIFILLYPLICIIEKKKIFFFQFESKLKFLNQYIFDCIFANKSCWYIIFIILIIITVFCLVLNFSILYFSTIFWYFSFFLSLYWLLKCTEFYLLLKNNILPLLSYKLSFSDFSTANELQQDNFKNWFLFKNTDFIQNLDKKYYFNSIFFDLVIVKYRTVNEYLYIGLTFISPEFIKNLVDFMYSQQISFSELHKCFFYFLQKEPDIWLDWGANDISMLNFQLMEVREFYPKPLTYQYFLKELDKESMSRFIEFFKNKHLK